MEYHGISEIRLRREGSNDEERADLWMYAVRCYEMLMVRQIVMEAVEARPYTKYEETLSVFSEIMALGASRRNLHHKAGMEDPRGSTK